MNNFKFPRPFVLALWFGVVASLAASVTAGAQQNSPFVFLITIDTIRADHVGIYGYEAAETPVIDGLAAEGIRFERAYTPVPVTLPAHSAMLTGAYPMRTGMRDFTGNRLSADVPTLAEELKDAGYATGAVVSAAVLNPLFGLNRGFDSYQDALARRGDHSVDVALEWLKGAGDGPVFFWLHLFDPHDPYTPPPPYDARFQGRPYDGEIAFTDAQVGRFLAYLKKRGWYDNSLIVLVGDHGEGLGEHGESTHGFFVYNSTLHVPLIIKPPSDDSFRPLVIPTPVSLVDLMPTILRTVGRRVPAEVQGRSLLPLMRGERSPQSPLVYSESFLPRLHYNWSELQGVQSSDFHYIDAPRPELYDLQADPREIRNVLSTRERVAADLRGSLAGLVRDFSAAEGDKKAEDTGVDPELMEQLRSLGYAAASGSSSSRLDKKDLPDPKDRVEVFELVSEALADIREGLFRNAKAALTRATEIDPESTTVRFLLGLTYYRMEQFLAAEKEFALTLQSDPSHSQAHYYRGLTQGKTGDRKAAIRSFRRVTELEPGNQTGYYNLGVAYMQAREFDQSIQAFRQAVRISPDYLQAQVSLAGVLYLQGQLDDAIAHYRKALDLSPQDPGIRQALANALKLKGLHQEADEILRANPSPPGR